MPPPVRGAGGIVGGVLCRLLQKEQDNSQRASHNASIETSKASKCIKPGHFMKGPSDFQGSDSVG